MQAAINGDVVQQSETAFGDLYKVDLQIPEHDDLFLRTLWEIESPQYLVEFADLDGREYAMATLQPHEVLALHYELPLAS